MLGSLVGLETETYRNMTGPTWKVVPRGSSSRVEGCLTRKVVPHGSLFHMEYHSMSRTDLTVLGRDGQYRSVHGGVLEDNLFGDYRPTWKALDLVLPNALTSGKK